VVPNFPQIPQQIMTMICFWEAIKTINCGILQMYIVIPTFVISSKLFATSRFVE
jgi:hypothetical protein